MFWTSWRHWKKKEKSHPIFFCILAYIVQSTITASIDSIHLSDQEFTNNPIKIILAWTAVHSLSLFCMLSLLKFFLVSSCLSEWIILSLLVQRFHIMSKTFPRHFEEYCYNLRHYSPKRKVKQAARHWFPQSRMVKFARLSWRSLNF